MLTVIQNVIRVVEEKKSSRVFAIFFCAVCLIKVGTLIWLWQLYACMSPDRAISFLAISGGDTQSYFSPFENLINEGTYYFDNGERQVFAGRMPYYGFLYCIGRLFLSIKQTYTFVVIVQIVLELWAVWLLCKVIKRHVKTELSGYITLIIAGLSVYWSHMTLHLLPESFSLSFLVITFYLHQIYRKKHNSWLLALNGLLLVFLTGFKPYFGILLLIYGVDLVLVLKKEKKPILRVLGQATIFSSAFFVLTMSWALRNAQVTDYPYILTEPYSGYRTYSNPVYKSYRGLMLSLGESDYKEWYLEFSEPEQKNENCFKNQGRIA